MPIVFADRVKDRTRTSGTGTILLENTVDGFQSFEAVGNGNQTYYGIEHPNGTWEIGLGTYSSTGPSLTRDTVISSSNAGALVNFDGGSKTVFVTIPSSVAANIIASTTFAFRDIAVAGQLTVSADSTTDTLTLVAGANIDITTNASTDTITIANDLSSVGQDILPSVDSDGTTGYTLGSPSFQWKELFVSNGSIYIGNVKLSNVAGKLVATTVINPGREDETEDPEDSDAASEIGGGGGGESGDRLVNGEYEVVLDSDGTLTFPSGNMTIGTLNGSEGIQGSTNTSVGILSQGSGGSSNLQWLDSLEEPTAVAAVLVNSLFGEGTGKVQIITGAFDPENPSIEHSWTFTNTGGLVFPDDTVQTTAYTGGGGDASYTPDDTDNWEDPAVNTITAALDELAARVTALQNFEIDGGNAYTPAAGELIIDGNGA